MSRSSLIGRLRAVCGRPFRALAVVAAAMGTAQASEEAPGAYTVELRVYRVHGAPSPELKAALQPVPATDWGDPSNLSETLRDSLQGLQMFTEAEGNVGEARLLMKGDQLEWNGGRDNPDVRLVSAPRVTLPATPTSVPIAATPYTSGVRGENWDNGMEADIHRFHEAQRDIPGEFRYGPAVISDGASLPNGVPYFEHVRDDVYELHHAETSILGVTAAVSLWPGSEGRLSADLLFRQAFIAERMAMDGVALDVGEPRVETFRLATTLSLTPGRWVGFTSARCVAKGLVRLNDSEPPRVMETWPEDNTFVFVRVESTEPLMETMALSGEVFRLKGKAYKALEAAAVPWEGASLVLPAAGDGDPAASAATAVRSFRSLRLEETRTLSDYESVRDWIEGLEKAVLLSAPRVTLPGESADGVKTRLKIVLPRGKPGLHLPAGRTDGGLGSGVFGGGGSADEAKHGHGAMSNDFSSIMDRIDDISPGLTAAIMAPPEEPAWGVVVDVRETPAEKGSADSEGLVMALRPQPSARPGEFDIDFIFSAGLSVPDASFGKVDAERKPVYCRPTFRYRFTLPDGGWAGFVLPLVRDEGLVVLLSIKTNEDPRETPL